MSELKHVEVIVKCSKCGEKREIDATYLREAIQDGLMNYTLCEGCDGKYREERDEARSTYEAVLDELSSHYGITITINV